MLLEHLTLTNFRCFGPNSETVTFTPGLTAFVGGNGSGKTAVMQALLRMFGVTNEQRTIRRQDFHIPPDELDTPTQRTLILEAIFAFPELETDENTGASGVPEFFNQMTNDEAGKLKCRLRLDATWTDDGSLDGAIEQRFVAVRTMSPDFSDDECSDIKALDRAHIQVIYVPAMRDGASQVAAFLRSRIWRSIAWTDSLKQELVDAGSRLNNAFSTEPGIKSIVGAIKTRWRSLHTAGTDSEPVLRPVDNRLQEFIRKTEVVFRPDESGGDRDLDELSDGQRSLFHIAMTAATLDVEKDIASGEASTAFQAQSLLLPSLTIIAVEEPENNLSPFFLSRIVRQIQDMTESPRAQAVISSHSASILFRVAPTDIRHFRLDPNLRTALVRCISLPQNDEEAAKYVREAVRTYPEMYFANFVILGEGSSEEVVLPRLAEGMSLSIDRTFIAIVPLGGRHVNHLWRLLNDLEIPHATLLDFDAGRYGGGWGRIKTVCEQLLKNGVTPIELFNEDLSDQELQERFAEFERKSLDLSEVGPWVERLQDFSVFFCYPLDLDMTMLRAFRSAYQRLESDMSGPSARGGAREAVLGENGNPTLPIYDPSYDDDFRWYRYLFLGRGKPSTHVRSLGYLTDAEIASDAPTELKRLLNRAEVSAFQDSLSSSE